jgi:hypothetical protein
MAVLVNSAEAFLLISLSLIGCQELFDVSFNSRNSTQIEFRRGYAAGTRTTKKVSQLLTINIAHSLEILSEKSLTRS